MIDDEAVVYEEPQEQSQRPVVRLWEHERASEVCDAALHALAEVDAVHRRGAHVVQVAGFDPAKHERHTATGDDGVERPMVALRKNAPIIQFCKGGALDYAIDAAIDFEDLRKPKGRPKKDEPPREPEPRRVDCPGRIMGMIAGVGGTKILNPLESIIECPSMRPDGTIIEKPGYDRATGYFLASNMALPHLGSFTLERALQAYIYLRDVFGPTEGVWPDGHLHAGQPVYGFPWRRGWEETIVPIALCMSLVLRPAYGCCPAFVIDASTPGSGKGKIVSIASIIATGEEPARAGWPSNPEEQQKVIGSYAAMAPPLIAWDNVRGMIHHPDLECGLTATPIYTFRVLGFSQMLPLPFRCICTFTGNNVGLGGDMPRRCIVCRLEPHTECPDKLDATCFRHPFIEQYVRDNRAKIIAALLTIARAYVLAKMPDQGLRMGSFDRSSGGLGWIELIGGSLAWVIKAFNERHPEWAVGHDITSFSGRENIEEPEEWGHVRTLLSAWSWIDPAKQGLTMSSVNAFLYPSNVIEHIRKGTVGEGIDWTDDRSNVRAAIQALSRCPDRLIPDTTKAGNALKPFTGRWFGAGGRERRFVHVNSPSTGKPFVPARWKMEER